MMTERKTVKNQEPDRKKVAHTLLQKRTKRSLLPTRTGEQAPRRVNLQQAHHMMKNLKEKGLMKKIKKKRNIRRRVIGTTG